MYLREKKRTNQEIPNAIRMSLLLYGRASVGKDWKGEILTSPFSRLYYIVDGEATFKTNDGKKYKAEKENWMLIPSGCSFSYECSNSMEHVFFHVILSDYDKIDLLARFEKPEVLSLSETLLNELEKALDTDQHIPHLRLHHSVYGILLEFIEKVKPGMELKNLSPCTLKAIKYIKKNLSATLTTKEIAENIFVSRSTLTKHFKKELSLSVNHYIHNLIMQEAAELVAYTKMSMLQISERFGFYDQFYFSRKFKEKFGMSPRNYRNSTGI